jgi:hypothetical protein
MKFATSLTGALLCATLAVHAQDTKTTTKTKTEADKGKVQQVTYVGCVQSGPETQSYVLDKVVPVTTTKTVGVPGAAGTTMTTSTSYILVPGEKVELQTYVGRKVEVTGMLIPAGEWKTETKTKVEREGAKDSTTKETTKGDSDRAHFRVMSVKQLNEPCM